MRILGRLALLFVIVPILELMLLIQMGQWVGLLPTLLLVVFTGVSGAWLARAEGVRVFFQFQRELASGRLPAQSLQDGLSVLVGGAFLLTPGILTDVAGFTLLFPPTRRWVQRRIRKRLERGIRDGSIRVVTMGPGGLGGGFGFGPGMASARRGDAEGAGDGERASSAATRGLDPSKGIDVGGGEPG